MNNERLKEEVHNYWNKASCGTDSTKQTKHTKRYFEEIESHRYAVEAQIFSFAQFSRFHGKKVLEVGIGAGTDFLQWVRAGAHAHGIDLTQEAIDNVKARLNIYGLQAQEFRVADAENLPYPDNHFDCVYSWGVIHHSPNTEQCLSEIIRVAKPGGKIKVMIYNRRSLYLVYRYLKGGFFKKKKLQTLSTFAFNHQESLGTKTYTFKEVKKILVKHPVSTKELKATVGKNDFTCFNPKLHWFWYCIACIFGWNRVGWFMTIKLLKNTTLDDKK